VLGGIVVAAIVNAMALLGIQAAISAHGNRGRSDRLGHGRRLRAPPQRDDTLMRQPSAGEA